MINKERNSGTTRGKQTEVEHSKDDNGNNKMDEPTSVVDVEKVSNSLSENNQVSEDVVTVNVNGMMYDIDVEDIRRAPSSRLYSYVFTGKRPLVFKRSVQSFDAMLAYYQTGELHMPTSVCPGSFKTELQFWGLDPQIMMKCCYYRYLAFHDDQETLDKFHEHLFQEVGVEKQDTRCMEGVRRRLWTTLDFHDKSFMTNCYFWLCTLMVLLSVATLTLSSLPEFRRNLTKCELEDFLGKPLKSTSGESLANNSCDVPIDDDVLDTLYVDYELVHVNQSDLTAGDLVLNETLPSDMNSEYGEDSMAPKEIASNMLNEALPNYISYEYELDNLTSKEALANRDFPFYSWPSDPSVDVSNSQLVENLLEALRPKVGIGKKTVRIQVLVYIDTIVLAFFTVDVLLRVLCCPGLRRYFMSVINIIDGLVVLSAYALMTVNFLRKNEKYVVSNFDILEIFQVMRVVRLIRIVRDVIGFKVLSFSLRVTLKDLSVLLLYLTLAVLIFANFIFFVESADDIESVPVGWWWAISTLTTVGYGDVVPRSLYGRLIGCLCGISGVVMISVAIPVVVKTFILLYAYAVLYKKSKYKPEDTNRFIHRQSRLRRAENRE